MLEALFNIAPDSLAGARLELALPLPVLAIAAAVVVLLALAAGGYLRARRHRGLAALRAGLALVAVLALARPAVQVPAPDVASGPVAVLLDDSMSMRIADAPGAASRGEQAARAFAPGAGALARELEGRFSVRQMRFGARLAVADDAAPSFASAVSDPLGALLDATSAGGLAAVVLVSDGGQVSGRDVGAALARLQAVGVPVHVVGVGTTRPAPDASVAGISVPPTAFPGDTLPLAVTLVASGFPGSPVEIAVRDAGVLVGTAAATLGGDGEATVVTVEARLDEPGLRALEVRVSGQGEDQVPGNDAGEVVVHVREQPARVLHVEGEPRFEVKFVRRALAADPALRLSSLVRTGDNRYLRLGMRDPDELADGFPGEAEPLYRYDVIVLGSVEASAFSARQLELLEAHVARRGGSLLLLGGRHALAEGGHDATSVASLAPVLLDAPAADFRAAARPVITREGAVHPVVHGVLDGVWRDGAPLPALAVVNPLRRAKPGASVLLLGDDASASPLVLLAWHRYGRGRVAVFAVRDSWRWRMHADMPPEDRTHELFWRGLLRWLAREVPGPVTLAAAPAVAAPGQTVEVEARLHDAAFEPAMGARAVLGVTTPIGEIQRRPLQWRAGADGGYAATFVPEDTGMHVLDLDAQRVAGHDEPPRAGVLVTAQGEEFRRAGLDEALLERIARRTGGSYRRVDAAEGLAQRVAATMVPGEAWRRVELWNAPALLLVMLALACGEWWLRRRSSLA